MATVPTVVPNELIESAWGNTVANELNAQCVKRSGAQTMTGTLTSSAAITGSSLTASAGNVAVSAGNVLVPAGQVTAGIAPTDTAIGAQMRQDGVILGTVNDPTPLATANLTLQRTGISSGVGGFFAKFNRLAGGATIGSITIVAGPGVAFNTTSDARLKTEVGPIPDPLELLDRLRPIVYEWLDPEFAGVPHLGFFAHEVQQVVPDAVTGDPDAVDDDGNVIPQQLDVSKLVPGLVAAVQALAARVADLEAAAS